MKSNSFSRSIVSVIDPTLRSQRSFHDPAVMTSHFWFWMSMFTPNRFAISCATWTSNPFHWPVCTLYQEAGLYFASVATRIVPALHTAASASVPFVSTVAHTPPPVDVAAGRACRRSWCPSNRRHRA